jgi:uncharacterized protein YecT (DUF1311 family)
MLLMIAALLASQTDSDPVAKSCLNASRTQAEMNACAQQSFVRADRDLNREYKQAQSRMRQEGYGHSRDGRPSGFALLRDAQRAWLADRDAFCSLDAYSARGGSLEPYILALCKAELTRHRTKMLRIIAPGDAGE